MYRQLVFWSLALLAAQAWIWWLDQRPDPIPGAMPLVAHAANPKTAHSTLTCTLADAVPAGSPDPSLFDPWQPLAELQSVCPDLPVARHIDSIPRSWQTGLLPQGFQQVRWVHAGLAGNSTWPQLQQTLQQAAQHQLERPVTIARTPAEEQVLAALEGKLAERSDWQAVNVPFADFCRQLEQRLGIVIRLPERAAERRPVTLCGRVSGRVALEAARRQSQSTWANLKDGALEFGATTDPRHFYQDRSAPGVLHRVYPCGTPALTRMFGLLARRFVYVQASPSCVLVTGMLSDLNRVDAVWDELCAITTPGAARPRLHLLDHPVQVAAGETTLSKWLQELSAQTGVPMVLADRDGALSLGAPLSGSLDEVLRRVLSPAQLTGISFDGAVWIVSDKDPAAKGGEPRFYSLDDAWGPSLAPHRHPQALGWFLLEAWSDLAVIATLEEPAGWFVIGSPDAHQGVARLLDPAGPCGPLLRDLHGNAVERQAAIQRALASDDPLVIGLGLWPLKAFTNRPQFQPYRSELLELLGSGRLHRGEHPALARLLYAICRKTVPEEELYVALDRLAASAPDSPCMLATLKLALAYAPPYSQPHHAQVLRVMERAPVTRETLAPLLALSVDLAGREPAIRERLMSILLAAETPLDAAWRSQHPGREETLLYFLQEALRDSNPEVRQQACGRIVTMGTWGYQQPARHIPGCGRPPGGAKNRDLGAETCAMLDLLFADSLMAADARAAWSALQQGQRRYPDGGGCYADHPRTIP